MRTFERIILGWFLVIAPLSGPAIAFDGAPVNQEPAIPVVGQSGAGTTLRKSAPPSATPENSLTALQYAADGGHPVAQWRLGRMYASGDPYRVK